MFGTAATLILTRSQKSAELLTLYEFVLPHLRKEPADWYEFLTSADARVPFALLVVLGTVLYQVYCKQNPLCNRKSEPNPNEPQYDKNDPRYMVQKMREDARKKGNYSPKMEKSLGELEGMFDSL